MNNLKTNDIRANNLGTENLFNKDSIEDIPKVLVYVLTNSSTTSPNDIWAGIIKSLNEIKDFKGIIDSKGGQFTSYSPIRSVNNMDDSQNNMLSKTLNDCINSFAEYLSSKRKSPKTISGYISDINKIFVIIARDFFNGLDLFNINLLNITKEQVAQSVYWLFNKSKLKPRTLLRLKHGWNCFCSFLGKEEWKIKEKINISSEYSREVISNKDIMKMLNYVQKKVKKSNTDRERIRWLRKEIAINIGWAEGLRSCEYGNVNFNDTEREGIIVIRGSKHKGYRTVPLSQQTKTAILKLKKVFLKCGIYTTDGGVFQKPDGNTFVTSTFRRWLKKVAIACGVCKSLAKTHGLRHRFAKNFHQYTKNDFLLADIMGHKSTETTRNYARLSIEYVQQTMQEASNWARRVNINKF